MNENETSCSIQIAFVFYSCESKLIKKNYKYVKLTENNGYLMKIIHFL